MRARELFERVRAPTQYYVHVTAADNLRSILKKGLVPNAANKGLGNYDDTRWLSLDGVYATKQPEIIHSNLRANHNFGHYGLVLLSVAVSATLPDEDGIEALLKDCYKRVMDLHGIDSYYASWIGEYFQTRDQNRDDDDPEWSLRDESQFWREVAEEFHNRAKGNDPRPMDQELISTLVEYWSDFEFEGYGDIDPYDWRDLKDKVTRRYPRLAHPNGGAGWSLRIPHVVGYSGRTRIVAVIEVIDGTPEVLYGSVPADAKELLNRII